MGASAKRILIAPLDWGLGHTTRCIPVIHALEAMGHQVVFAGDARQQAFIKQTFPQIDSLLLEGYRVRYGRRALMFTLLWQMPRLFNRIKAEHQWLIELVSTERIDGIISDNRYGLWHPDKPSIIITHQPAVLSGLGKMADGLIRRAHYQYLKRFGEVWIPDSPGALNLAGALSHLKVLPPGSRYIGWLSQFLPARNSIGQGTHILILLSGPEPQRTMLSDKLWEQAKALESPVVFVEGKADAIRIGIPPHICHMPLADARALQPVLQEASLVICRSGYSTLMDLMILGKKAVLIPTPGQTEQEYLAASLSKRGLFQIAKQDDFSLEDAVRQAASASKIDMPSLPLSGVDLLTPALLEWTARL